MNEERKPIWLDLEDPIYRVLGLAAALLEANTEDGDRAEGITGAYQVLYQEARQLKQLYHSIDFERH